MDSFLTTPKAKPPQLLEILERTIETHGMREFTLLTQKEMARGVPDPTVIPSLEEFWDRAKADLYQFSGLLKRRVIPPLFTHPLETLKRTTALFTAGTGFIFSWSVPQKDIRFSPRKAETGAIFIHRPLVVALSIFISWLIKMLELTESHPSLSLSDKNRLKLMNQVLNNFKEGFELGVYRKELLLKFFQSIRILGRRQDVLLKLDPQLFQWLESQIKNN
jgi:hypothetical protein